jgi:RimJ/RimL family protein N-acetyltransferase
MKDRIRRAIDRGQVKPFRRAKGRGHPAGELSAARRFGGIISLSRRSGRRTASRVKAPANVAQLPVLQSECVRLRQPVSSDVATRLEVPRDPEEHRMYGGSGEPKGFTADEVAAELAAYASQTLDTRRAFVIAASVWPDGRPVSEPEGRYVGVIRLSGIDWHDHRARLAIGIFDRRFWSRGYGSEAIRLLLRYGFEELGLHRVDLRVLHYNTRAIRAYERCGLVREGVEREAARVDGRWHDDVIMSILEHEYRAQPWAGTPGVDAQ